MGISRATSRARGGSFEPNEWTRDFEDGKYVRYAYYTRLATALITFSEGATYGQEKGGNYPLPLDPPLMHTAAKLFTGF